jgi:hypothetical protein
MLTRSEFNSWFSDYAARFPAVHDYVARQSLPETLLDTWHQNIAAFDTSVLRAVTAAILCGDLEPVQNVSLGTFGAEVRRLCREVLEQRRRRAERRQQVEHPSDFSPLAVGSMADMYHACCAVYELLPGADDDVVMAAICLADDHTVYERDQSHGYLEGAGISWAQVQEKARQLKASGGVPLVREVPGEV